MPQLSGNEPILGLNRRVGDWNFSQGLGLVGGHGFKTHGPPN
jgi:hypothetical protein